MTKKLRRRLLIASLFILVIAGSIYYYRDSILISLGEYLITEYPLEKADAIAVLAGSVPDRILEGIDIYKQGYAPLIILTKEEKPPGYDELLSLGIKMPEGYDINQMIALKLGVPAASIVIVDERINSTYSEEQALYGFLKKRNLKSVILVTSKYHTTRATKLFNFVTDRRVKLITRPSKYDTFDPKNWWRVRRDMKQVLFEYQKLVDYCLIRMSAFFN
ncbi:MAG: YdcF family protein [Ignavibacteriales bacterium]